MRNINDTYVRDLDLNLLRVFAVVAEEGSITRAAARLYVTQPAVSAAMRRLTLFVGAQLMMRQGHGVAMTTRGIELLSAAREHLQPLLAATLTAPVFDPKASTATIRLGLVDASEPVVLPPLLALLRSEAPGMQLIIVPVQFRTVEELLLASKVDVAICVADDLPKSILRKPIGSGKLLCLYDPRFCRLSRKPSEREYLACEHVAVSYAGDARGIVEDALGKKRNVRVGVPSFGYVADIVDGSPLVGTVPEMLALHITKARPHLRSAPLPFSLPPARLDLLWSRVADDDKAVSFARGLLEQVVRSLEAEGRGRRRKGKPAGR
jgi:LysR family transcriptional activator of mexEF-oprN operon